MRIVGAVAEYDPFHQGHAYHLAQAREKAQAEYVLCVMSGCSTQRGQGAIVSPACRAAMALSSGADVVVELPVPWAVREAEHFALGAIHMFQQMGCVTHLAFGAETEDLATLQACAALLEAPDAPFNASIRQGLALGLSHPAAMGQALERRFPGSGFQRPNNILALCYLRAMLRLHWHAQPVLIPRQGNYHATALTGESPSATALRGALRRGAWSQAAAAMPAPCYELLRKAAAEEIVFDPTRLDAPLLYLLRTASPQQLRRLPGCVEGLENRLLAAAKQARTREELLSLVKTRRYSYARLSRLCTHLLLGLEQSMCQPALLPPYARLLGFRKAAAPLLRAIKKGDLPLVEKAADASREHPVFQADCRAYDLWSLGVNQPTGLLYRQPVVCAD